MFLCLTNNKTSLLNFRMVSLDSSRLDSKRPKRERSSSSLALVTQRESLALLALSFDSLNILPKAVQALVMLSKSVLYLDLGISQDLSKSITCSRMVRGGFVACS